MLADGVLALVITKPAATSAALDSLLLSPALERLSVSTTVPEAVRAVHTDVLDILNKSEATATAAWLQTEASVPPSPPRSPTIFRELTVLDVHVFQSLLERVLALLIARVLRACLKLFS